MNEVVLIGYSGHAYVVLECLRAAGIVVSSYFDREKKRDNPYELEYLGSENDSLAAERLSTIAFFPAIGDNRIRERIVSSLLNKNYLPAAPAIHPSAIVSETATLGKCTLVAPGAKINALANVGRGAIINTGAIVEHECNVGPYAHIAPGTILTGNVSVGPGTLIGAGAVVLPGVRIGEKVVVGAGAVVTKNVPDNTTIAGNPARPLPPT